MLSQPPGERPVVSNPRPGGRLHRALRATVALTLWAGCLWGGAAGWLYVSTSRDLPSIDCFDELMGAGVTRFEAADGHLAGWRYRSKRESVDWEHIPRDLILALLAGEDQRFFFHGGIDLKGVARAALSLGGRGGGSSLTQQLAKELFTRDCDRLTEPGVPCAKRCVTTPRRDACLAAFDPGGSVLWAAARRAYHLWAGSSETEPAGEALCHEASRIDEVLGRKVPEAIMARRMEDRFSKQQILTWYLNRKWFGQGCYGVQTAAHHYFGRDVWNLSLAQMTLLVAVLPSPHRWNPVRNLEMARKRMRKILGIMERNRWITAEDRDRAVAEAMNPRLEIFDGRGDFTDHVPYFTSHAFRDVAERFGAGDIEEDSWLDRNLTVSMQVESAHQMLASQALGDALERLAIRQGFPGPLGNLDSDDFQDRMATWPGTDPGDRILARVLEVTEDTATLELGGAGAAVLRLADARWAAPYTEFSPGKGRRRSERVSLDRRLKDMRKALGPGDILYVSVLRREGERVEVGLVPIPLMEGALVSFPVVTGGLDTLVGGWDFDRNQSRRYLSDSRQLASTMKPIYYAWRYNQGMPPSARLSGATYTGGGYDEQGNIAKDVIAWEALVHSRDTASQRVFSGALRAACRGEDSSCVPEDRYRAWGRAMGLSDVDKHLRGKQAEALGAHAQPPLAMARAYGTLASRGRAPRMPLIRKVEDREGRLLERHIQPLDPHGSLAEVITALWDIALPEAPPTTSREPGSPAMGTFGRPLGRRPAQQISAATAYMTTSNLVEVIERGTGKRFRRRLPNGKRGPVERTTRILSREAAGKTGTLPYDVWFDGFTFDRVAVAWIGADRQERPLGRSVASSGGVFGANTALPAWVDYMAAVHGDAPAREMTDRHYLPVADEVAWWRVDAETGVGSDCQCIDEAGARLRPCTAADGVRVAHRANRPPDVVCPAPEGEGEDISEDDL